MRERKGVAGLNILLGVIVTLFILGVVVMVYSLLGSEVEETAWESKTIAFTNTSFEQDINSGNCTNVTGIHSRIKRNCVLTITQMINETGNTAVALVPANNYTINADCSICLGSASSYYNNSKWNATGSYIYDSDTTSSKLINESTKPLSDVVNYNSIIIVITTLVVLGLLVAFIISAIKGTGEVDFSGKESRETA